MVSHAIPLFFEIVPSQRGVLEGSGADSMFFPAVHGFQYLKSIFYVDRSAGADVYLCSVHESNFSSIGQRHVDNNEIFGNKV